MPTTTYLKDMKFAESQIPCTLATVKRQLPITIAIIAVLCALAALARSARAEIFDGGVNSANLGKGEWIYVLANAVNHLADSSCPTCRVAEVTDVSSMMAYFKTNLSLQYVVVKAGDGGTPYPSSSNPQFTTGLVSAAHAQGLKIFGYTRSYGTDLPGELSIATNVFKCGADGFVFDAEGEWPANLGNGVASAAWQLLGTFKTNWPTKFLAHSPYADIYYKFGNATAFPYKEFGYWCDAVLPMVYWYDWSQSSSSTVRQYGTPVTGLQWMDQSYSQYHNWLATIPTNTPPTYKDPAGARWTKAIKPLVPLGQADAPGQAGQTFSDITSFVGYCKTDPTCVTAGGYKGCCFFRVGLQDTNNMLPGIAAASIGDSPPVVTSQPKNQTLVCATAVTFSVTVTGTPPLSCQWRKGGASLADATNATLVLNNLTTNQVGSYDVVATNWAGGTTSAPARLTLIKLFSPVPQRPALQINGVGNYRVDYEDQIAPGTWTVWTNFSLPVVGQQQVVDLSASNRPARFYRVVPQ
jgi:hypothetical protein